MAGNPIGAVLRLTVALLLVTAGLLIGYWLVASDGGMFSYNAPFYGAD